MIASGVIDGIDRSEVPNSGARAWRVLVTPDAPTALAGGDGKLLATLAFYIAREPDPSVTEWATAPIGAGDRLVLPLVKGSQRVRVARVDGSTVILRMVGWIVDPGAPLS